MMFQTGRFLVLGKFEQFSSFKLNISLQNI